MPVSLDLDPIEAGCLHALGGVDVLVQNARDVPVFELLRKCAMRGLSAVGR